VAGWVAQGEQAMSLAPCQLLPIPAKVKGKGARNMPSDMNLLGEDGYFHDRERLVEARERIQAHLRWRREHLQALGVTDHRVIETDGQRIGEFIAERIAHVETPLDTVEVTEQLADEIPNLPLPAVDGGASPSKCPGKPSRDWRGVPRSAPAFDFSSPDDATASRNSLVRPRSESPARSVGRYSLPRYC